MSESIEARVEKLEMSLCVLRTALAKMPRLEGFDDALLLAELEYHEYAPTFPEGRRCPRCDGQMAHYRLGGWRCMKGCVP